jgi:hypothetical protein
MDIWLMKKKNKFKIQLFALKSINNILINNSCVFV